MAMIMLSDHNKTMFKAVTVYLYEEIFGFTSNFGCVVIAWTDVIDCCRLVSIDKILVGHPKNAIINEIIIV